MGGSPAIMKDGAAFASPQIGTVPAASAAGTVNGTGIDRLGLGSAPGMALSADLVAETGATTGGPTSFTVDAKIQDSADNSSFADYVPPGAASAAAITTITVANTLARKRVDLSGARRYIRVVTVVAFVGGASPTVGNATFVELFGLQNPPTA
jgi:hypothetical protein